MKKAVLPTILILTLCSILFLLVAKEYKKSKRASNPILNKPIITEDMQETEDGEPVVSGKRMTSDDTCIVVGKDPEEKVLMLKNIKGGDEKPLKYDGTTKFLTKHDGPLTASEIKTGDIVDISFTTHDAKLSEVKQSDKAWENRNVTRFEIDENGKTITVGDDNYKLAKNCVVASDDKVGKLLDITSLDSLTVKGIDNEVFSIQIEEGHGYIRVTNDSYFVGGWIEVGQNIITVMTEGMLIPAPEGTYDVKVTNKGYVGRERVSVERDKETKLDLSKIEIEEVAVGHVMFTIVPDYAQLYVDGLMTDFEERVPLEYGIHSVRVELAGYETVHANIRVGSELANISIELDEESESSSSSSSSDSSSGSSTYHYPSSSSSTDIIPSSNSSSSSSTISSTDTIISDNKKLYIESPAGAEVYIDGAYIGIAPCNTTKVTGNHTITLSKSGYETKSYTINVGNDGKDLTMSFSELTPVQ